jgi:hypothetical protein
MVRYVLPLILLADHSLLKTVPSGSDGDFFLHG